MTHAEKAANLFSNKFNCAQSVFASFSEDLGIPEETALKTGACFGSGMKKGEVCGACTGALMALGMKYGHSDGNDNESKQKSGEMAVLFLEEFKKANGSYICRELLGCDIGTKDGLESAMSKNLFTEFCPKMVISATEIAEKIMAT